MVGQVLRNVLQVLVHRLVFVLLDLERRFVNEVYGAALAEGIGSLEACTSTAQHSMAYIYMCVSVGMSGSLPRSTRTTGDVRTNHSLRVVGAGGAKSEFPQVFLALLREGV